MLNINGTLMNEEKEIGVIGRGLLKSYDEKLIPLFLKRTGNIEEWLRMRSADSSRVNIRKLKSVIGIEDDIECVLSVNASMITDRYWIRFNNEKYEDIRFKSDEYCNMALKGEDCDYGFVRTPEMTNIGSFEKCWKLINNNWWLYKCGSKLELFSEMFISILGEKLGFDMAHYELDGDYIKTIDFTGGKYNFEPMRALSDDNEDYECCYGILRNIDKKTADDYVKMIWLDTICFNMDRHTENFGILRDIDSGKFIKLAPYFDHNIALISRGYPKNVKRDSDVLIRMFIDFIRNNNLKYDFPEINEVMIDECLWETGIDVDYECVKEFILNGQKIVKLMLSEE